MKNYDLINDDPVIRTFTGKWVNVFDPDINTIDIIDIAHALSFQCRFGGHLAEFYSVAQHSIWCFQTAEKNGLSKRDQLAALLHDASEAYLVDVPRPIKYNMPEYRIIEDSLMKIIADVYDFDYPLSPDIKTIDSIALKLEWDYLKIKKEGATPLTIIDQSEAEGKFIEIFNNLKDGRQMEFYDGI